jgi:hypothetical protein
MFCSGEKKNYLWKKDKTKMPAENMCSRHFQGAFCFKPRAHVFGTPTLIYL